MKVFKYYLICLLVVLIDHATKLAVHFNMRLGEDITVFDDWFHIHYLLNPGMAFGMELDFIDNGKLLLSLFRIGATGGIAYYLYMQAKHKAHPLFLWSLALILGGAIGNAIDSIFYGVFLEDNAIIGAETPWFHGRVIDMLYFPLFDGYFPEWLPVWGGRYFSFFSAIFNIADACIFIGAVTILIFQKKMFPEPHHAQPAPAAAVAQEPKKEEANASSDESEASAQ